MGLHPDFPKSPHDIVNPEHRWFPADEDLRDKGYEKLLPPLVSQLRKDVQKWRESNYEGASFTSQSLLNWWFKTDHPQHNPNNTYTLFQYYFCQREAIETVIYLYEVVKAKDKYDLIRFDSSGAVSAGMFDESWLRLVVKMATGSGKTKVMSLILAWCFFHKTYEEDSQLARNFLVIAPNIIVLDRIRHDFEGLKIFFEDPVVPDNGYEGKNWRDDFQLTLHIQDDVGTIRSTGNIFLTNIHRIYEGNDSNPSYEDEDTMDYFLGTKPTGKTNESKVDLSDIVRDIDELVVLNDEAHHIHDKSLAWFKSIQDIHNKLLMKGGTLSLQLDVTATPRHNNGAIFVQTISDYPLVEAIYQDVVKHPALPDSASRGKLQEHQSAKFTEKYKDYLHLGYLEWEKVYNEHVKMGKKAILFVMTDDTKNCDDVAEYLESRYPDLKDAVLTIHTKNNGEISESVTGKKGEELQKLRKDANDIDDLSSPYKAIVSVLMLKEGWDVKNVTTIVGLRAYSSKSNILPEQTLGRGLRRMYRGENVDEIVSVVGTDAFMDFVESIKSEGVELEKRKMGEGSKPNAPIIVEVDTENTSKDIDKLDIEIPVLTPRYYREYKNLSDLEPSSFGTKKVKLKQFSEEEKKEIVFRDITLDHVTHKTLLDTDFVPDHQSVIGYFTNQIMYELRLVGAYDVLYGKVKEYIQNYLFDQPINLSDLNTIRNLSELEATETIYNTFKEQINALTVVDKGESEIKSHIKIGQCRPFVVKDQPYLIPQKSIFNKIIGDNNFELEIAGVLENAPDVISYIKNYFSVQFRIDYQKTDGSLSNYYPDFIVKTSHDHVCVVETKGREDLDDIEKIKRLKQWCEDINQAQSKQTFSAVYLKQDDWERQDRKPKTLNEIEGIWKV